MECVIRNDWVGQGIRRGGVNGVAGLDDLDRVLSTDANFMLGPWIAAARAWGNTTAESDLYEWNARNQLTLWGPSGLSNVVDYATKEWGGLTSSFFKPRWQLFLPWWRPLLARRAPMLCNNLLAEV